MAAPVGRTTRAVDRFDTTYVDRHLYLRKGHLLFWSERGITYDYDMSRAVGPLLERMHYFYIVSCPVPGIDPIDNEGKAKLGFSSATANTTPHFAYRINEYRRFYGDAVKLHCVVVFKRHDMARDFEEEIKWQARHLDENGSNAPHQRDGGDYRKHEWFRLRDLRTLMTITEDTRNAPMYQLRVAAPRRNPVRRRRAG